MFSAFWVVWAIFCPACDDSLSERRVRQPATRDTAFVLGTDRLPGGYDSRRQRYDLFQLPGRKDKPAAPLLLVLPAGDAPLEWDSLRDACHQAEWNAAIVLGAGGSRPIAQRLRASLDVLEDALREVQADPARTYVLALGDNASIGGRLVFSLPERFAGLIVDREVGVPGLAHLRHRARARLSVALLSQQPDALLLRDLGIRSKRFDPPLWGEIFDWLEADRARREKDAKKWPANQTREQLLKTLLAQAKKSQSLVAEQYQAAALLEWLHYRYSSTEAGREAREIYEAWRTEPSAGYRLAEVVAADRRPVERALARAAERSGQVEAARMRWQTVVELTPDPEEKAAAQEQIDRLAVLWEQRPYLGLTLQGETNLVREAQGPAHRAGIRPGDRIVRIGDVNIFGYEDLSRLLQVVRPGIPLAVETRRGEETRLVELKVGKRSERK
jgi:hypothetical protein